MKTYEAIGIIETQYFAVAMEMLDSMSKSADIEFLSSQNQLGGKLVSLIIGGKISDISVAIETAERIGQTKPGNPLKKALMITNPDPQILHYALPAKSEEGELQEPEEQKRLEESEKPSQKSRKRTRAKKPPEEDHTDE